MLALLDISSAFDIIDHPILLQRLHTNVGFTGAVLKWFLSNLTDRTHYFSISNHCSAFSPVHSGVPQCSFLGPFLFTMYIKPLSAINDSHSIIHHSIAYDLQKQMSAPPDGTFEVHSSLQSCIRDDKVGQLQTCIDSMTAWQKSCLSPLVELPICVAYLLQSISAMHKFPSNYLWIIWVLL